MYSQLIRRGIPASPPPSFVCLDDGTMLFSTRTPLPTQSATIIAARGFDGNGTVDLFVPHRDGGPRLMLRNDGSGRFPGTAVPSGPALCPSQRPLQRTSTGMAGKVWRLHGPTHQVPSETAALVRAGNALTACIAFHDVLAGNVFTTAPEQP